MARRRSPCTASERSRADRAAPFTPPLWRAAMTAFAAAFAIRLKDHGRKTYHGVQNRTGGNGAAMPFV